MNVSHLEGQQFGKLTAISDMAEDMDASVNQLQAAKNDIDYGECYHSPLHFQDARLKINRIINRLELCEKKLRLLLQQAEGVSGSAGGPVATPSDEPLERQPAEGAYIAV
jgi:hypothetical protein